MRTVILIWLALACSVAQAADVNLIISGGKYWIVAAGNPPTLAETTPDKILRDGTYTITVVRIDTTPIPPDNPDPTDRLAAHKAAVLAATTEVVDPNKTNTRMALATLYRTVAGLPVMSKEQLDQATRTIFNSLNLPTVWTVWKTKVDASASKFSDVADAKAAWIATADALESGLARAQ